MEFHNMCSVMMKTMYMSNERLIVQVCEELGHSDKASDVVQKLLSKEFMKIKPKKDPTKPKKPRTSYMFYCADVRAEVSTKNPDAKMGEISKILGSMWNKTEKKIRVKYEKMAEDEKDEYNEKLKDWKLNNS